MQRPLCCAQAPDIFTFVVFTCFAAIAGDIDAAASAAAIPILTIRFMKSSQIIPIVTIIRSRAKRTSAAPCR